MDPALIGFIVILVAIAILFFYFERQRRRVEPELPTAQEVQMAAVALQF